MEDRWKIDVFLRENCRYFQISYLGRHLLEAVALNNPVENIYCIFRNATLYQNEIRLLIIINIFQNRFTELLRAPSVTGNCHRFRHQEKFWEIFI